MKTLLLTAALAGMLCISYAGGKPKNKSPLTGTWSFTNASKEVDFAESKIFVAADKEQFIFNADFTFSHIFLSKDNQTLKSLKGTFKLVGNSISMHYADVDFTLNTQYFFIGNDLVLGSALSHFIFTKDAGNNLEMAEK